MVSGGDRWVLDIQLVSSGDPPLLELRNGLTGVAPSLESAEMTKQRKKNHHWHSAVLDPVLDGGWW